MPETPSSLDVLVLGGGGREHALCWKIAQSPRLGRLFCAPGNAGIAQIASCVDLNPTDADGVIAFAREHHIDLVVVGPEDPLVAGIVDRLTEAGIKAFGPSAEAARLEGSKGFTKDLCREANIPTADYARFTDAEAAKAHLTGRAFPIVVKADGPAAGKGVTICPDAAIAMQAIDEAFGGKFGTAGSEVVIEDYLEGPEVSFFALSDGKAVRRLASAQDHKRAFDGDKGPNTGGMGAYSPAPVFTADLEDEVMERIIRPTIETLARRGTPYKGVLFAGLMLTPQGPQLIEYNVRFGDPETQVLMMRLSSCVLTLFEAVVDGTLDHLQPHWSEESAITVVMAAKGYPGAYEKGSVIRGLEEACEGDGVEIFHAGTGVNDAGDIVATGGRVLNVSASGESLREAKARAYHAVEAIDWPEGFYRHDIGWRALD